MRHQTLVALLSGSVIWLSACEDSSRASVSRAIDSVTSVDQQNMAELMLTAGDPEEAVAYFSAQMENEPDSLLNQRGLGRSLMRAGRANEAVPLWRGVTAHPEGTNSDKVALADAQLRATDWAGAERTLNSIPPTYETFDRYRLEALVADSKQNWRSADHFYEIAAGLTTRPSSVYNNWGYSHLTRENFREAERLFTKALQHDPSLFTAKNNLALARAGQGNYTLPLVQMTQQERAVMLYTMAIAAIRKNDVNVGRVLLEEAIDTHPQHYEEAVRAMRALDGAGTG